ncbi:hypothetical protein ZWY2020_024861 [Hordeum vulgare]|nr:hypothetical protein ZWY2020_024861 [Hordeum vulgare]
MGLCMSSGGAAAAAAVRAEGQPASTAMVLLPTGELREYPRPATAAEALEDAVAGGAGWFLCDADAMGFEGPVAADLAALAVRASAALLSKASVNASGSGGRRRRAGSVSPLVFAPPPEVDETLTYKTVPALAAKRRPVARVKSAGRMQSRFAPDLTAIPECE